jgi:hypothetical protein
MSYSLLSADRKTHIKIVAVALVAVVVVVAVGLNGRTTSPESVAGRDRADGPVIKAGAPATYSSADRSAKH